MVNTHKNILNLDALESAAAKKSIAINQLLAGLDISMASFYNRKRIGWSVESIKAICYELKIKDPLSIIVGDEFIRRNG